MEDLRLWAQAIAAGIPEEIYWNCTPQELDELFKAFEKVNRRDYLRHALVAATIVNVNRKPGSRYIQPEDFLLELPKPEDYMSVDEGHAAMGAWAMSHNKEMLQ